MLEGKIQPGRVFDRVTNLDGVPDGYRAMNEREAIKVMDGAGGFHGLSSRPVSPRQRPCT